MDKPLNPHEVLRSDLIVHFVVAGPEQPFISGHKFRKPGSFDKDFERTFRKQHRSKTNIFLVLTMF